MRLESFKLKCSTYVNWLKFCSHLQNCSELAAANFSSPKSERGFVLRREKELLTSIANSPAR